jgi:hypothetical protein
LGQNQKGSERANIVRFALNSRPMSGHSPLLANIYMNRFLKHITAAAPNWLSAMVASSPST